MSLIQPTNSECFSLKLPSVTPLSGGSASDMIDESVRNKLGLEYRTGAAVTNSRSNIYVHGGLTLPLNLHQVNSLKLQKELILYFAKHKSKNGISFQNLDQYISSEVFFLDLISRTWNHIPTTVDEQFLSKDKTPDEIRNTNPLLCPLKERLFHSICFCDSSLYIFGGLIVSPQNGYELIATNELWRLDLKDAKPAKWTLVSDDPRIVRRFNHTIHVKNEHTDARDTKLIIVGGLNNLNEPIHTIDVYNLTQNCWQDDAIPPDSLDIDVNVDGYHVSLTNDRNFSILVENNEAKVPALAFFTPNCQNTTDRTIKETRRDDLSDENENHNTVSEKDRIGKIISPITALPLMPKAEGMRMAYNAFQKKEFLVDPFNLKSPTGDYFGYNIILGGFYPDRDASNFKCYIFDIPSGKWTRVGFKCPDSQHVEHRFWRVFVWKSHHQAMFLGTKKDDGFLPSVQRFDCLLTFSLSMLNAFNKTFPSILETPLSVKQHELTKSVLQNNINDIFKQRLITNSDQKVDDNLPNDRNDSTVSATPSQFEKYIKYIAPSVELTNVRSVFPSYAMVLGKDSLEIFGKSLSDFEFITSEGDTIGIPLYLLRKRWGRYFDLLLAKSYSNVVADYEQSGAQSSLIKISPKTSRAGSTELNGDKPWSSIGSLSNFFSKQGGNSGMGSFGSYSTVSDNHDINSTITSEPGKSESIYDEKHLLADMASSNKDASPQKLPIRQTEYPRRFSSVSFRVDDEDELVLPHAIPINKNENIDGLANYGKVNSGSSSELKRTYTSSSLTSSSGGLVFRVPFQEKSHTTTNSPPPYELYVDNSIDPNLHQQKRRSSLMALTPADKNKINYPWKSDLNHRRASHPAILIRKNDLLIPQSAYHPSSRLGASTRSSISYVSSSSDRMGNSVASKSRNNSISDLQIPGILNVTLPPRKDIPNEPLPNPILSSNRTSSLYEYGLSNKGSPLSSRRPSYINGTTIQDLKYSAEIVQNSLDKQLLENTADQNSNTNSFSKEKTSAASSRPSDATTSYGKFRKSSTNNERQRLSVTSNTDSIDSRGSTFPVELEPLMIPRSLYMPWPTLTVRAFSEFFYTGHVGSKWPLAPVVLDLLIMSKIYEIPLLYSLIAEALYSLIGKKEESLYVVCNAAKISFTDKINEHFGGDKDMITKYLEDCRPYKELMSIKDSLEAIEDGFLEVDILGKGRRFHSTSSKGSSEEEGYERFSSMKSDASAPLSNFFRNMYDSSPRDSLGSFGSFGGNMNPPYEQRKSMSLLSPRFKKKSSLSKEIGTSIFDEDQEYVSGDDMLYSNIQFRRPGVREESPHGGLDVGDSSTKKKGSILHIDPLEIVHSDDSSSSSSSSSTSLPENQGGKGEGTQDFRSLLVDLNEDKPMSSEKTAENSSRASVKDSYSRTDSLTNLESSLGVLSLKKMRKKVKKGDDYFDDSIDPLMKINTTLRSPSRLQRSFSRVSGGAGGSMAGMSASKLHKDSAAPNNMNTLTLENMLAANSPPPVNYVIKTIYRTAVLVNDSRLMIRCLDCMELSGRLRNAKNAIKVIDINNIPRDV